MTFSPYRRITALALICLLAATAKAQIVYFGTPVTFSPAPAVGAWTRYQFSFSTGTYDSYGESDDANPPILAAGSQLFRFTVFNNSNDGNRTGVQLEYASLGTKVVASGVELSPLSFGTTVSSATATTDASSGSYINWTNGEQSYGFFAAGSATYMGFAFEASGQTHYGWAAITVANDAVGLTINEWAYNSEAGQSITVGQTAATAIPEPSTYAALAGLLALGATVVIRRRRQASAAAVA